MKKLFIISLVFLLLGCRKYEIETVPVQQAAAERPVTLALKEAYVNRLYISLTGKKATPLEFEHALAILGEAADSSAREAVLQEIFQLKDYHIKRYSIARADYLESVDTAMIARDYQQAQALLQSSTGNAREYWQDVIDRLYPLLTVVDELKRGQIDQAELHFRIVDNPYYEQINMGTENLVVATFQNFLFRYPTQQELALSSDMVNGFPASLFLETGSSHADFLQIFFNSNDYFEGQVIDLYRRYLFREPTTAEISFHTQAYVAERDYQKLQLQILTSDEYFFN